MRHTVLTVFVLLTAASTASAGPLSITDIIGSWVNAIPPANAIINNVADQGTDAVRWGDTLPRSGYDFTPGGDILSAPLNTPLLLGSFTHINNTITAGTQITSIQYDFGFSTNGVPNSVSDTFNFAHNETPNPAADLVTVSSLFINQQIVVGGDTYFFNLLGFSTDGGTTFSNVFVSEEGQSNMANLYGEVTAAPVPEPASLLFVGAGLLALAATLRRHVFTAAPIRS